MITCEHTKNLLDAYLNDELAGSMAAEVDAHLLDCPHCRHQLSLLEACGNVVRLDINEPKISEDFTDRLVAILEENASPTNAWPQLRRGIAVATGLLGIAAAVALVVGFYPRRPTQPAIEIMPSKYTPAQPTSLVETVTEDFLGWPIGDVLDAGERISSVIELGRLGLIQTSDPIDLYPAEFNSSRPPDTVPAQTKPELDVLETLPDLEEDSEVL